ncbi:cysteine hydrolase family protein [Smaragdicoccus niigatensis]|uniref:cysteine hydrolase family protein n=1 Tax=Smaragdicoccus niigatensis TaxID=359359 RepID=UPI0003643B74|nr:isochorismatase family cysteine hydrolase [Smaragdicoccus niigatensis]
MNVVNRMMDRSMRGFIAARMRPHLHYGSADTAVILVAPQSDLLAGDVSNLTRLVGVARDAGITVIYAPMAQPEGGRPTLTPSQQAILEAGILRAGTRGADIHPELAATEDDIVLEPFAGLSAFTNPELFAALAASQLGRVIVAGARTDIEVDSTARDALEAGLHTTVVSDCCTGSNPAAHQATVGTTLPRLVHAVLTLADLGDMSTPSRT